MVERICMTIGQVGDQKSARQLLLLRTSLIMIAASHHWDITGLGRGTVHRVYTVHKTLTKYLHMHKVSVRWVQCLLTSDNNENRMKASKNVLRNYKRNGVDFLDRVVTTDETWMFFV